MNNKPRLSPSIKDMTFIGLMTAILCILSPFSLTLPVSPVPLSLGSLAIYFVVTVSGRKRGTICVLLYILLGLIGIPVFTGFTGGAGKLFGPTGGYIIGYIFLALIYGWSTDYCKKTSPSKPVLVIILSLGGIAGTLVLYFFGTLWLAFLLKKDLLTALWLGVIPYIPGDIIKFIFAIAIGIQLRRRLSKTGFI